MNALEKCQTTLQSGQATLDHHLDTLATSMTMLTDNVSSISQDLKTVCAKMDNLAQTVQKIQTAPQRTRTTPPTGSGQVTPSNMVPNSPVQGAATTSANQHQLINTVTAKLNVLRARANLPPPPLIQMTGTASQPPPNSVPNAPLLMPQVATASGTILYQEDLRAMNSIPLFEEKMNLYKWFTTVEMVVLSNGWDDIKTSLMAFKRLHIETALLMNMMEDAPTWQYMGFTKMKERMADLFRMGAAECTLIYEVKTVRQKYDEAPTDYFKRVCLLLESCRPRFNGRTEVSMVLAGFKQDFKEEYDRLYSSPPPDLKSLLPQVKRIDNLLDYGRRREALQKKKQGKGQQNEGNPKKSYHNSNQQTTSQTNSPTSPTGATASSVTQSTQGTQQQQQSFQKKIIKIIRKMDIRI